MQNRPQGEWSLHAQVTFSHGGNVGAGSTANTSDCHPTVTSFSNGGAGGVRMEYSFKTQAMSPEQAPPSPPPSQQAPSGYGFQRGNILFTTRPPQRGARSHSFHFTGPSSSSATSTCNAPERAATLGRSGSQPRQQQDSGYNSEQLSPRSYGSLPSRSRPTQAYNRRCMSTYSIVLADVRSSRPVGPAEFSPVPEMCEESVKTSPPRTRSPHSFSSHLGANLGTKKTITQGELKDAASQTISDPNSPTNMKPTQPKMGSRIYNARRKTESDMYLQVPTLQLPEADPDEDKTKPPSRRLARSPARLGGKSPLLQKRAPALLDSPDSSTCSVPSLRQRAHRPRTVHIDVYCTGSDEDADGSDTSSTCSSNTTTPPTVYESDKLKVVHSRPKKNDLPPMYARKLKQTLSRKSESFKFTSAQREVDMRGYESDEGTMSSLYPSRSSFDSIDISLPGGPSRDSSWSTITNSALLFEEDSSSWKDTTESGPDIRESSSLAQSDSFEYADSFDRDRILEKEHAWSVLHPSGKQEHESKTWQSPEAERRHLLQQQRFKDFLTKHVNKVPHWSATSTASSTEESWEYTSEDGSHFGLKREDTVRRASTPIKFQTTQSDSLPSMPSIPSSASIPSSSSIPSFPSIAVSECESLSDSGHQYSHIHQTIGPFGRRPPSTPPPPMLASKVTSPFTTSQGIKTIQSSKAAKFGPMVGSLKKPGGNHIGPSKNPECACDHCRRYYEETSSFRGRTCSVGDVPRGNWQPTTDQVSGGPAYTDNSSQPSL